MIAHLRPAFAMIALFTALTGLVYPLAMTGAAQVLFPRAANGSLIERGGIVIGSELIGQSFASAGYFHGRPSAAGAGYDAAASSGSNLGPTSRKLLGRVRSLADALRAESGIAASPADAVTASASGLDPHISPRYAARQVKRIADARGVPQERVAGVLAQHTAEPWLGFTGEPRVNVLELNLALDAELSRPQEPGKH